MKKTLTLFGRRVPLNTDEIECKWFYLCTNEATTERAHPTLGAVPICETCNAKIERITNDNHRIHAE